jgi:hypothetical protein
MVFTENESQVIIIKLPDDPGAIKTLYFPPRCGHGHEFDRNDSRGLGPL